jgi:hypothetical protein
MRQVLVTFVGVCIHQGSSHSANDEEALASEDRFHHDAVVRCIPRVRGEASCLRSHDTCLRPKKPSLELCKYTRNDCESIVTHADVPFALRVTGVVAPIIAIAIAIVTATIITIGTKMERKSRTSIRPTYNRTTTSNGKSVCEMRKE